MTMSSCQNNRIEELEMLLQQMRDQKAALAAELEKVCCAARCVLLLRSLLPLAALLLRLVLLLLVAAARSICSATAYRLFVPVMKSTSSRVLTIGSLVCLQAPMFVIPLAH